MKSNKFLKIGLLLSFFVVILIGGINYIIDPMGYNNKFETNLNKIKIRLDERVAKFGLIKNKKYNSFIFGSSRNTIIDPDTIDNLLKNNSQSINVSFSAGMIDEFILYIDYLINSKREIKNIFIPIDLFSFSDEFIPKVTLPRELQINKKIDTNLSEYFSFDMFLKSLSTIYFNIKNKQSNECNKYLKKGMRCYKDYFNAIKTNTLKQYIEKNVTYVKANWHVNNYSKKKADILIQLYYYMLEKNINLYIYTNPITISQIRKGKSFYSQLKLLKYLIGNSNIKIFDFNNINNVNLNDNYFIDSFHFNYEVADCIVNKILTNKSICGEDFGILLTKDNIDEYLENIRKQIEEYDLNKVLE